VPTDYRDILDRFSALVQDFDPVGAAAVIGSRGRGEADEDSDLDLLVFAAQPAELLSDNGWLSPLGRIWAAAVDRSLPDLPVKRLLLDGAAEVDLMIVSPDAVERPAACEAQDGPEGAQGPPPPAASVLSDVVRRGFEPVKRGGPVPEGLAELAAAAAKAHRLRPSQEQFSQLVAEFWLDAVRAARLLARGEVWSASRIVDGPLKDALVESQSWIVRAVKGGERETYWRGRHLEEWAGERFVGELTRPRPPLFGAGVERELAATMDLFRLAAIQAASRWSLDYAEGLDRRATVWVRTWR
jgi:predicted nucleotidyltransferase